MSDFTLDASGDLIIENGDAIPIIENSSAVRQKILIGLNTFRGVLWSNYSAGVPWVSNDNSPVGILGKLDKTTVDIYIKELILATYGVSSIQSYNSTYDYATSKITISSTVLATDGTVVELANIQIGQ